MSCVRAVLLKRPLLHVSVRHSAVWIIFLAGSEHKQACVSLRMINYEVVFVQLGGTEPAVVNL